MNKINKKAIVFASLSPLVVTAEDGTKTLSLTRKELINVGYDALIAGGVDKHEIKTHLIPSYIQMARMKLLKGESEYKHHKGRKVKAVSVIPEGSQWKAVKDDVTEYFKNRQSATVYVGKNGGKEAWAVSKLA